jgi:hypothetical protein
MRISSHKTSNVQFFIFSYLRKQKNMLRELLGSKKKYCRLNITGADAARQHLKLFSLCKVQFAEYQIKNALHFFVHCSNKFVNSFTSVFFPSVLFPTPQIQISKFRKCMYVGLLQQNILCLLDSLFSCSHKISFQKTLVQNRAA